jgi:hypothetical protein
MEVQYQMMGHVAGLAAVSALRDDRPVQAVDIPLLQRRLRDGGQVLA